MNMHIYRILLRIFLALSIFLGSISPIFSKDANLQELPSDSRQEKQLTPEEISYQKKQEIIDNTAKKNAESVKGRLKIVVSKVGEISPNAADILSKKYFGVMLVQYMAGLLILLLTFILTKYILKFIFAKFDAAFVKSGSKGFANAFLKNVRKPLNLFAWAVGVYAAFVFILCDSNYVPLIYRVTGILFWSALFWLLSIIFDSVFTVLGAKFKSKSDSGTVNLMVFLKRVVKISVIVVAILTILTSCGVNVNTIIASLGIGGMALAFASQDTIANFFGSVSIILDRPFIVGDWVKTSSCEGLVESIGFRSTRIRTFSKTIVTIPNSSLAKEAVENFTRMPARKVKQVIGLTYSTTPDQIQQILEILRLSIAKTDGVDSEHGVFVEFADFGASSLDLSVIYYVKHIDAANFAATKRRVNLVIMREVSTLGLSFAFPSTSIYVESLPNKSSK